MGRSAMQRRSADDEKTELQRQVLAHRVDMMALEIYQRKLEVYKLSMEIAEKQKEFGIEVAQVSEMPPFEKLW